MSRKIDLQIALPFLSIQIFNVATFSSFFASRAVCLEFTVNACYLLLLNSSHTNLSSVKNSSYLLIVGQACNILEDVILCTHLADGGEQDLDPLLT